MCDRITSGAAGRVRTGKGNGYYRACAENAMPDFGSLLITTEAVNENRIMQWGAKTQQHKNDNYIMLGLYSPPHAVMSTNWNESIFLNSCAEVILLLL